MYHASNHLRGTGKGAFFCFVFLIPWSRPRCITQRSYLWNMLDLCFFFFFLDQYFSWHFIFKLTFLPVKDSQPISTTCKAAYCTVQNEQWVHATVEWWPLSHIISLSLESDIKSKLTIIFMVWFECEGFT